MFDALVREIVDGRVILFVGSGVSAGVGLPRWSGLIGHLGEELGYEEEVFSSLSNSFPSLAQFYRNEKGSIGTLRDWMQREWTVPDDKLLSFSAHQSIFELGFQLVYTTNYDDLLERSFELRGKKINKIVNVRDMPGIDYNAPTIVKFHGDLADDNSLVLSENDYFDRLAFSSPLDLKLQADALGRTILFVGYSLSDINMRLMLYRIKSLWRASGFEAVRPRSYIFMPRPNAAQESVVESWGIEPIIGDRGDDVEALTSFLFELQSQVSAART